MSACRDISVQGVLQEKSIEFRGVGFISIKIKEVISKKDLKKWIEFPNSLYKNNAYVD